MDGLLIVDKPVGPTSHDVVARVRRATGERRIGHTGTLDPRASGVLPLVLGRATRLARFLSASDKTYCAVIQLGVETDSYDAAGRQVGEADAGVLPDRGAVEGALSHFRGTFMQQPPAFSAKKIGGTRSHRLARQRLRPYEREAPDGRASLPKPVSVTVHALELLSLEQGRITLEITCSAGFYVRSLAHDLGRRLKTGGHLAALRRTRVGELSLDQAIPLEVVERDAGAVAAALIPPRRTLAAMPAVTLTEEGVRRARQGRDLGTGDLAEPRGAEGHDYTRLLDESGDLVGIAEPAAGLLHPSVVLV